MIHQRLHNALFLLVILAVLAVTAWSIVVREEGTALRLPEIAVQPEATADGVEAPAKAKASTTGPAMERTTDETRRQIERGLISKEPARYYRKEAP